MRKFEVSNLEWKFIRVGLIRILPILLTITALGAYWVMQ